MKFRSLLIFTFLISSLITGCSNRNEKNKEAQAVASNNTINTNQSIHQASLNGDIKSVTILLEKGVKVDSLDEQGRTALMYAAFNGHSAIVKKLIEKDASINISDNEGRTALMMASSGPFPEVLKLLLEQHADVNATDKAEYFTALMYAAAEGQMDNVKLLLSYKADPFLKDIDGDNAMTFAISKGHNEIAALLRSRLKVIK